MQINRNITTNPCGEIFLITKEKLDEIRNRVMINNRDGKIESIVNGIDFTEKLIEEDEEYKNLRYSGTNFGQPVTAFETNLNNNVFYIDYTTKLI